MAKIIIGDQEYECAYKAGTNEYRAVKAFLNAGFGDVAGEDGNCNIQDDDAAIYGIGKDENESWVLKTYDLGNNNSWQSVAGELLDDSLTAIQKECSKIADAKTAIAIIIENLKDEKEVGWYNAALDTVSAIGYSNKLSSIQNLYSEDGDLNGDTVKVAIIRLYTACCNVVVGGYAGIIQDRITSCLPLISTLKTYLNGNDNTGLTIDGINQWRGSLETKYDEKRSWFDSKLSVALNNSDPANPDNKWFNEADARKILAKATREQLQKLYDINGADANYSDDIQALIDPVVQVKVKIKEISALLPQDLWNGDKDVITEELNYLNAQDKIDDTAEVAATKILESILTEQIQNPNSKWSEALKRVMKAELRTELENNNKWFSQEGAEALIGFCRDSGSQRFVRGTYFLDWLKSLYEIDKGSYLFGMINSNYSYFKDKIESIVKIKDNPQVQDLEEVNLNIDGDQLNNGNLGVQHQGVREDQGDLIDLNNIQINVVVQQNQIGQPLVEGQVDQNNNLLNNGNQQDPNGLRPPENQVGQNNNLLNNGNQQDPNGLRPPENQVGQNNNLLNNVNQQDPNGLRPPENQVGQNNNLLNSVNQQDPNGLRPPENQVGQNNNLLNNVNQQDPNGLRPPENQVGQNNNLLNSVNQQDPNGLRPPENQVGQNNNLLNSVNQQDPNGLRPPENQVGQNNNLLNSVNQQDPNGLRPPENQVGQNNNLLNSVNQQDPNGLRPPENQVGQNNNLLNSVNQQDPNGLRPPENQVGQNNNLLNSVNQQDPNGLRPPENQVGQNNNLLNSVNQQDPNGLRPPENQVGQNNNLLNNVNQQDPNGLRPPENQVGQNNNLLNSVNQQDPNGLRPPENQVGQNNNLLNNVNQQDPNGLRPPENQVGQNNNLLNNVNQQDPNGLRPPENQVGQNNNLLNNGNNQQDPNGGRNLGGQVDLNANVYQGIGAFFDAQLKNNILALLPQALWNDAVVINKLDELNNGIDYVDANAAAADILRTILKTRITTPNSEWLQLLAAKYNAVDGRVALQDALTNSDPTNLNNADPVFTEADADKIVDGLDLDALTKLHDIGNTTNGVANYSGDIQTRIDQVVGVRAKIKEISALLPQALWNDAVVINKLDELNNGIDYVDANANAAATEILRTILKAQIQDSTSDWFSSLIDKYNAEHGENALQTALTNSNPNNLNNPNPVFTQADADKIVPDDMGLDALTKLHDIGGVGGVDGNVTDNYSDAIKARIDQVVEVRAKIKEISALLPQALWNDAVVINKLDELNNGIDYVDANANAAATEILRTILKAQIQDSTSDWFSSLIDKYNAEHGENALQTALTNSNPNNLNNPNPVFTQADADKIVPDDMGLDALTKLHDIGGVGGVDGNVTDNYSDAIKARIDQVVEVRAKIKEISALLPQALWNDAVVINKLDELNNGIDYVDANANAAATEILRTILKAQIQDSTSDWFSSLIDKYNAEHGENALQTALTNSNPNNLNNPNPVFTQADADKIVPDDMGLDALTKLHDIGGVGGVDGNVTDNYSDAIKARIDQVVEVRAKIKEIRNWLPQDWLVSDAVKTGLKAFYEEADTDAGAVEAAKVDILKKILKASGITDHIREWSEKLKGVMDEKLKKRLIRSGWFNEKDAEELIEYCKTKSSEYQGSYYLRKGSNTNSEWLKSLYEIDKGGYLFGIKSNYSYFEDKIESIVAEKVAAENKLKQEREGKINELIGLSVEVGNLKKLITPLNNTTAHHVKIEEANKVELAKKPLGDSDILTDREVAVNSAIEKQKQILQAKLDLFNNSGNQKQWQDAEKELSDVSSDIKKLSKATLNQVRDYVDKDKIINLENEISDKVASYKLGGANQNSTSSEIAEKIESFQKRYQELKGKIDEQNEINGNPSNKRYTELIQKRAELNLILEDKKKLEREIKSQEEEIAKNEKILEDIKKAEKEDAECAYPRGTGGHKVVKEFRKYGIEDRNIGSNKLNNLKIVKKNNNGKWIAQLLNSYMSQYLEDSEDNHGLFNTHYGSISNAIKVKADELKAVKLDQIKNELRGVLNSLDQNSLDQNFFNDLVTNKYANKLHHQIGQLDDKGQLSYDAGVEAFEIFKDGLEKLITDPNQLSGLNKKLSDRYSIRHKAGEKSDVYEFFSTTVPELVLNQQNSFDYHYNGDDGVTKPITKQDQSFYDSSKISVDMSSGNISSNKTNQVLSLYDEIEKKLRGEENCLRDEINFIRVEGLKKDEVKYRMEVKEAVLEVKKDGSGKKLKVIDLDKGLYEFQTAKITNVGEFMQSIQNAFANSKVLVKAFGHADKESQSIKKLINAPDKRMTSNHDTFRVIGAELKKKYDEAQVAQSTQGSDLFLPDDPKKRPVITSKEMSLQKKDFGKNTKGEKLSDNRFWRAEFGGLVFDERDGTGNKGNIFNDAELFMANFRGCKFLEVDFSKMDHKIFDSISFANCEFRDCKFPKNSLMKASSFVDVKYKEVGDKPDGSKSKVAVENATYGVFKGSSAPKLEKLSEELFDDNKLKKPGSSCAVTSVKNLGLNLSMERLRSKRDWRDLEEFRKQREALQKGVRK